MYRVQGKSSCFQSCVVAMIVRDCASSAGYFGDAMRCDATRWLAWGVLRSAVGVFLVDGQEGCEMRGSNHA